VLRHLPAGDNTAVRRMYTDWASARPVCALAWLPGRVSAGRRLGLMRESWMLAAAVLVVKNIITASIWLSC